MLRRGMLMAGLLLALLGSAEPGAGQTAPAAPTAPRAVIVQQMQAFADNDLAAAFALASPRLQQLFQTPQRFGQMVQGGYPMVWRHQGLRFLGGRRQGPLHFEKLIIADLQGRMHLLEYQLEYTENGWRIAAVRFLDAAPPSV